MTDLIRRNTPDIADRFILRLEEKRNGKSFFEFSSEKTKIIIVSDTKIGLAQGYYEYLKKYCSANISHCGNTSLNEIKQAPLPTEKYTRYIEQEKRVYLNYCTLSYSMRFWDFSDWEKEIDFMAMNGINMPLGVVGYEAVMYYTLLDFGFSENEALSFISGPSFWPWQMMTNIDSVKPVMDKKYIEDRLFLGKKIIGRELSFGMTPIQQGFAGQVPKRIGCYLKDAKLRQLPTWCGFDGTYQLDPLDKNFDVFGKALLEKQKELFGSFHYYACDPFHENKPPVEGKEYLNSVGKAIINMYKDFDKDAVWVMQAWSLREDIVKSVEKNRLLILDIDGSKANMTDGFWGYNYICGTLHNFGDRNSLHGSIELLAENQYKKMKEKYPTAVGTGLFPEGFFQNPLYYDLAFAMLTRRDETDIDLWLKNYAERRYGSDEKCLKKAMLLLKDSCYSKKCIGRETGSIICARPDTAYRHTAPNDFKELRYDNRILFEALGELLKSEKAEKDGFYFDVCDILRQFLSNSAKEIYLEFMRAYFESNKEKFENLTEKFLSILLQTDRLLSTRKELTLREHYLKAENSACCENHKKIFTENELTLISIWGPTENNELFDYSWREWGGLIKSFYYVRWKMFIDCLKADFGNKDISITKTPLTHNDRSDFETTDFQRSMKKFELNWIKSYTPEAKSDENTIDVVRDLYKIFN